MSQTLLKNNSDLASDLSSRMERVECELDDIKGAIDGGLTGLSLYLELNYKRFLKLSIEYDLLKKLLQYNQPHQKDGYIKDKSEFKHTLQRLNSEYSDKLTRKYYQELTAFYSQYIDSY